MIIQRLTPLVNNLMHETLFTKSMLQKENESLSILFLGQAKIQLLPESFIGSVQSAGVLEFLVFFSYNPYGSYNGNADK